MSELDAEFEVKAAEIAAQFPEGLVAYLRNQRDSLGRYVRDEGWLDLVNKRDADLLDARTQIERLEARNVALERVVEAARPCAQLLPGPNGRALNRALAAAEPTDG